MKRVRRIFIAKGFGQIDSDDPRLRGFGTLAAAMIFGQQAAQRALGPRAECLEISPGKYHAAKKNQKRGARRQDAHRGLGWTDWIATIGTPMGCGIYECEEIVIPIRISRARGEREFYEEPAFRPAERSDQIPPFKHGQLPPR